MSDMGWSCATGGAARALLWPALAALSAGTRAAAAAPTLLQAGRSVAHTALHSSALPTNATAATLRMIAIEQAQMLRVIDEAKEDFAMTAVRLGSVAFAANRSSHGLQDLVGRTTKLRMDAVKNSNMAASLNQSLPGVEQRVNATLVELSKINTTVEGVEQDDKKTGKLNSLEPRVDEATRALQIMKPRLADLKGSVDGVDATLFGGNISHFVQAAVGTVLRDNMEDIGRGFAVSLPGKQL